MQTVFRNFMKLEEIRIFKEGQTVVDDSHTLVLKLGSSHRWINPTLPCEVMDPSKVKQGV